MQNKIGEIRFNQNILIIFKKRNNILDTETELE